jgi:ATP-dependent RNA helicase RhlE
MPFEHLRIIEPILRALREEGYETPTPIQEKAIPPLLQGRDVLGSAQTGTGKTAAFAIPILQILNARTPSAKGYRPISTLILTPTRELALQIKESFDAYGRHLHIRNAVIFGGVGQAPQTDALKAGVDVLVATPGRLLDLMGQGFVDLRNLTIFVLDEADRMLDMGFIHDVKKVIEKLPAKRQTMLFSATMPQEIADLAQTILSDPIRIAVVPVETTVDAIDQKVCFVAKKNKTRLLIHLLDDPAVTSALVFSRTKHGANKIVKDLAAAGIRADAIHGNKSQTARVAALGDFKAKRTRILVATDIAARGLDIERLSHVINYDLPEVPETYIHRIGRTGRAGFEGESISFCDVDELPLLRDIVKHIKKPIPVLRNHPHAEDYPDPMTVTAAAKSPKQLSDEPKEFSRHDARNQSMKHSEKREPMNQNDRREPSRQQNQNQNQKPNQNQGQNPSRTLNQANGQERPKQSQERRKDDQNRSSQPNPQKASQPNQQEQKRANPQPQNRPKPQIKKPNHPEKAYDPNDFVLLERIDDRKIEKKPQHQKTKPDQNRSSDRDFPEPLPEKKRTEPTEGDPLWEPEIKPAEPKKTVDDLPGGWKRFDPTKLPGYKAPDLVSYPDMKKSGNGKN